MPTPLRHQHSARTAGSARRLAIIVTAALAWCAGLPAVAADAYPTHPIRLVVPFPPGGGADATARLLAQKLGDALKQSVVVDNRAGANGLIGTETVAKSPPDGYTLLLTDRGALGINPSLYKNLPYDPNKDFAYVGIAVWAPYVLIANPKVAANTLPELIDYAKKNPGKLNYASFGTGSMPQMGMESLAKRFGVQFTHVPYKGGGPANAATLSGEVDMTLATIGPAMPYIKDGRVKPLVVGAAMRSPLLPQTASIVEAGGAADTIPNTYFGFAFPAKTPPAIVGQMADAIRAVLAQPDVVARFNTDGFQVAKVSPEEMADVVRNDIVNFNQLASTIGIKPE